ncbi:MAG: ATP-dependent zinc metalloprotease FtsH [Armatimonadetes bacterium]|nr:ATP-dependent zinc metalloprotease FtsH [Armatimonadota bacterium]
MMAMVAFALYYAQNLGSADHRSEIPYSRFRDLVREDRVAKVVVADGRISGELKPGQQAAGVKDKFATIRPTGDVEGDLLPLLDEHHVEYKNTQPSQLGPALFYLLVGFVPVLLLISYMRRSNPAERAVSFGRSRARQHMETDTKTTFADIAGIDEPKAELEEIVAYLREPDRFRRLGGRIPRGVLLVGSPGTGKTLLAKAVAGEAKVPFFSMSGSDFVELFVGVGASRVRDLFRQAEQAAGSRGCIVFIDELDALGKARGHSLTGGSHDEREQTLNQLLVEMDGFDTRANVIVMAATNRPDILDPALLRPGRFDRQVTIPAPDVNGREAILRVHARHVKVDPTLDLRRVASRTPGFVGADLANLVNEAALLAARREHESVLFEDFDDAIDRVSIGIERRSQPLTESEQRVVAYHEAGHALVGMFSEHADPVHKVSIIPRGLTEGVTISARETDRHIHTEQHFRAILDVLLGGRVAEEVVFDVVSSGAYSDIKRVTNLARSMVAELGMSPLLGPLNYETGYRTDPGGFFVPAGNGQQLSEATAQLVDSEVRRFVDEAYGRVKALLSDHRAELEALAQRLIEVETVERAELYAIAGLPEPEDTRPVPEPSL